VAVILGGIATSVVIFMLKTNDWGVRAHLDRSFVGFVLESLPYFWLGLLAGLLFLAYYNYRHTSKGYRYSLFVVLGVALAGFAVLGLLFFGSGLGKAVENSVLNKFPSYQKMHHQREIERWSQPEKGLLGGEVMEFLENNELRLEDFEGNEWRVSHPRIPEDKEHFVKEGMMVKAIGEKIEEGSFEAESVRPWERNLLDRKERDGYRKGKVDEVKGKVRGEFRENMKEKFPERRTR